RFSPFATTWLLPVCGGLGASVVAGVLVSPIITPGRSAETCCSSFRICRESVSIFVFCRSIFLANSSSRAVSDLSPDGSWAEAVVHIVAAKRKENEPRAKRYMEAILAERRDGGKRAQDLTIQRSIRRFSF